MKQAKWSYGFILFVFCFSTQASANPTAWEKSKIHPWLFGLSFRDYEIKSDGVMEAEMLESSEDVLEEDPKEAEYQTLLEGNEEILMFNADIPLPADDDDKQAKVVERPQNFYTIAELIQHQFTFGTFETEGYCVLAAGCDCPPRSRCEPCAGEFIIISDVKKSPEGYQFSTDDLIVFTGKSDGFVVGSKYRFIIQVLDVKTTAQTLNNLKLIYYKKIDS